MSEARSVTIAVSIAPAITRAITIAVVGAESTGKTTLAADLAAALAAQTGCRVAWVPEQLREWCERSGRTPQVHEQASILRAQHERIDAAAGAHDIVVCDTTALMTAVYSRIFFGDRSLDERAATLHRRRVAATLLTDIDLPWVADGLQRSGPQVQQPVDDALRELMQTRCIDYAVVSGVGEARLQHAMAAVAPALLRLRAGPADRPAKGLFTGLANPSPHEANRAWACECCLPDQERALRRLRS